MNKSIKKLKSDVNNVVYIGPKQAPERGCEIELNYGVRGISLWYYELDKNQIEFRPQGLNIGHIVNINHVRLEDEIEQGVNNYLD
jgi:hypothetical protein